MEDHRMQKFIKKNKTTTCQTGQVTVSMLNAKVRDQTLATRITFLEGMRREMI